MKFIKNKVSKPQVLTNVTGEGLAFRFFVMNFVDSFLSTDRRQTAISYTLHAGAVCVSSHGTTSPMESPVINKRGKDSAWRMPRPVLIEIVCSKICLGASFDIRNSREIVLHLSTYFKFCWSK